MKNIFFKTSVLFLILVVFTECVHAQVYDQKLVNYFTEQQAIKDSIFDKLVGFAQAKGSSNPSNFNKSRLAAISYDYILFRQEDDIRANKAANVDFLQSGSINGNSILGSGISVAVFDGGKVLATHEDFQSNGVSRIIDLENNILTSVQPIAAHPTAVSGFIAANGTKSYNLNGSLIANATRGVVPLATIKTVGFEGTTNGDIYAKIARYNEPISNHSYGSNFGWSYQYNSISKVLSFYYPVDPNIFNSNEETLAGVYLADDYNYDLLVSKNPKLAIIKSAGNYDGIGPDVYPNFEKKLYKYVYDASSDTASFVLFQTGDIIPKTNSFNGAYSITTGSLAKNIIVVGAIDLPSLASDFRINSSNSIKKAPYSSVGPRKDGGIKPDLVAVGTGVIHPTNLGNDAYSSGQGTSYSAPKVTGVIAALTELKRKLENDLAFHFDADEIKAILLHTTKEAGAYPGPDNKYGWGALDAKAAAELVLSTYNRDDFFAKQTKQVGVDYSKTFSSRNGVPLKVTLSWVDPPFKNVPTSNRQALDDQSSRIINDLDLRIIDVQTNQVYYPWKLDITNVTGPALKGDNTVDNVEQILIENPIAGRNYKIVISNKGMLYDFNQLDAGNQPYTLLITGANDEVLVSDKNTFNNKVVVFPTVTSGIVNIVTELEISKIDIFDLTGKLVSTFKTKTGDISNLAGGLYLLKITSTKGEVVTKRIIKE